MARDLSVTFIDAEGGWVDEIVEATNNGSDITLSSEGGVKLVMSTQQIRELCDDTTDLPRAA